MTWTHRCGWTGEESDLDQNFFHGILCSYSCPKCGDDWPFLFDDWGELDDQEEDPEILDSKSRKLWEKGNT